MRTLVSTVLLVWLAWLLPCADALSAVTPVPVSLSASSTVTRSISYDACNGAVYGYDLHPKRASGYDECSILLVVERHQARSDSREDCGALTEFLAAEGGAAGDAMLGGRFANPRSMRNVNPLRDTMNCGECAVYGDDILAGGNATVAGRSGLTDLSSFERIYGQTWSGSISGASALGESIGSLPVGSRGLVFGVKEGADVGHYFNFVNTKAGPVFLDFQKGATISPGSFSGFRLLQTH